VCVSLFRWRDFFYQKKFPNFNFVFFFIFLRISCCWFGCSQWNKNWIKENLVVVFFEKASDNTRSQNSTRGSTCDDRGKGRKQEQDKKMR
jgi:hypothetical protein